MVKTFWRTASLLNLNIAHFLVDWLVFYHSDQVFAPCNQPLVTNYRKLIRNFFSLFKVPSMKQQNRKRDVTKRMASMASISELSAEEFGNNGGPDSSDAKVEEKIPDSESKGSLRQAGTVKSKKQANPSIKNRLRGIW